MGAAHLLLPVSFRLSPVSRQQFKLYLGSGRDENRGLRLLALDSLNRRFVLGRVSLDTEGMALMTNQCTIKEEQRTPR